MLTCRNHISPRLAPLVEQEIRIPIPAAIAEALKRRIEVLTSMLNRALATLPGAILDLIREDRAQKFEAKRGARSAQKQTTGLVVSLLASLGVRSRLLGRAAGPPPLPPVIRGVARMRSRAAL